MKRFLSRMCYRLYYRPREWWMHIKHPPVVIISRSGWATPRPQVHVSVGGYSGSQSVYTWDADAQGEACATMYGHSLARILRRKVRDERTAENEPQKKGNQGVPKAPRLVGA